MFRLYRPASVPYCIPAHSDLVLYFSRPACLGRRTFMRAIFTIAGSTVLAISTLLASSAISANSFNHSPQRDEKKMRANLTREIRHQLLLLPNYSVFDNLQF